MTTHLLIAIVVIIFLGGCGRDAALDIGDHESESGIGERYGSFTPPRQSLHGGDRIHPTLDTSKAVPPGGFHFQRHGPIKFLHFLRHHEGDRYHLEERHYGWIRASDIPELMAHVSSKEPCAFVTYGFHGSPPQGRSTVGREAIFLIQGYRDGAYPPDFDSQFSNLDENTVGQWYKHWMRQHQKR